MRATTRGSPVLVAGFSMPCNAIAADLAEVTGITSLYVADVDPTVAHGS